MEVLHGSNPPPRMEVNGKSGRKTTKVKKDQTPFFPFIFSFFLDFLHDLIMDCFWYYPQDMDLKMRVQCTVDWIFTEVKIGKYLRLHPDINLDWMAVSAFLKSDFFVGKFQDSTFQEFFKMVITSFCLQRKLGPMFKDAVPEPLSKKVVNFFITHPHSFYAFVRHYQDWHLYYQYNGDTYDHRESMRMIMDEVRTQEEERKNLKTMRTKNWKLKNQEMLVKRKIEKIEQEISKLNNKWTGKRATKKIFEVERNRDRNTKVELVMLRKKLEKKIKKKKIVLETANEVMEEISEDMRVRKFEAHEIERLLRLKQKKKINRKNKWAEKKKIFDDFVVTENTFETLDETKLADKGLTRKQIEATFGKKKNFETDKYTLMIREFNLSEKKKKKNELRLKFEKKIELKQQREAYFKTCTELKHERSFEKKKKIIDIGVSREDILFTSAVSSIFGVAGAIMAPLMIISKNVYRKFGNHGGRHKREKNFYFKKRMNRFKWFRLYSVEGMRINVPFIHCNRVDDLGCNVGQSHEIINTDSNYGGPSLSYDQDARLEQATGSDCLRVNCDEPMIDCDSPIYQTSTGQSESMDENDQSVNDDCDGWKTRRFQTRDFFARKFRAGVSYSTILGRLRNKGLRAPGKNSVIYCKFVNMYKLLYKMCICVNRSSSVVNWIRGCDFVKQKFLKAKTLNVVSTGIYNCIINLKAANIAFNNFVNYIYLNYSYILAQFVEDLVDFGLMSRDEQAILRNESKHNEIMDVQRDKKNTVTKLNCQQFKDFEDIDELRERKKYIDLMRFEPEDEVVEQFKDWDMQKLDDEYPMPLGLKLSEFTKRNKFDLIHKEDITSEVDLFKEAYRSLNAASIGYDPQEGSSRSIARSYMTPTKVEDELISNVFDLHKPEIKKDNKLSYIRDIIYEEDFELCDICMVGCDDSEEEIEMKRKYHNKWHVNRKSDKKYTNTIIDSFINNDEAVSSVNYNYSIDNEETNECLKNISKLISESFKSTKDFSVTKVTDKFNFESYNVFDETKTGSRVHDIASNKIKPILNRVNNSLFNEKTLDGKDIRKTLHEVEGYDKDRKLHLITNSFDDKIVKYANSETSELFDFTESVNDSLQYEISKEKLCYNILKVHDVYVLRKKIKGFKYNIKADKYIKAKELREIKKKKLSIRKEGQSNFIKKDFFNYKRKEKFFVSYKPFVNGVMNIQTIKESQTFENDNNSNKEFKPTPGFYLSKMPKCITKGWSCTKVDESIKYDMTISGDRVNFERYDNRMNVLKKYKYTTECDDIEYLRYDGRRVYSLDKSGGEKSVIVNSTRNKIEFPAHIIGKVCRFCINYGEERYGVFYMNEHHIKRDLFTYEFIHKDNTQLVKEFYMYENDNMKSGLVGTKLAVDNFKLYRVRNPNIIKEGISGFKMDENFILGKWVKYENRFYACSQYVVDETHQHIEPEETIYTSGRGRGRGRGGNRGRGRGKPVTILQKVIENKLKVNDPQNPGQKKEVTQQALVTMTVTPIRKQNMIHPENVGTVRPIQPVGTRPIKGTAGIKMSEQFKNLTLTVIMILLIMTSGVSSKSVSTLDFEDNVTEVTSEPSTNDEMLNDQSVLTLDDDYCVRCIQDLCEYKLQCFNHFAGREHILTERVDLYLSTDDCEVNEYIEDGITLLGNDMMPVMELSEWRKDCINYCYKKRCDMKCFCETLNYKYPSRIKRSNNLDLDAVWSTKDRVMEFHKQITKIIQNGEKATLTNIKNMGRFCGVMFFMQIFGLPCDVLTDPFSSRCYEISILKMKNLCIRDTAVGAQNAPLQDNLMELRFYSGDKDLRKETHRSQQGIKGGMQPICGKLKIEDCVDKKYDEIMSDGDVTIFKEIYENPKAIVTFRKKYDGQEILCDEGDECKYKYWSAKKWYGNTTDAAITCKDIIDFGINKQSNTGQIKFRSFSCHVENDPEIKAIGNPVIQWVGNHGGIVIRISTNKYDSYEILSGIESGSKIDFSTNSCQLNVNCTNISTFEKNYLIEDKLTHERIRMVNGLSVNKRGNCIYTPAHVVQSELIIRIPKNIGPLWYPVFSVVFTAEEWQCETRSVCKWGEPSMKGRLTMPPKIGMCENQIVDSILRLEDAFSGVHSKFADLIDRIIENPVELFLGEAPDSDLARMITRLWDVISKVSPIDYLLLSIAMILFMLPWTKPLAGVVIIAWLGMKISSAKAMDVNSVCGALDASSYLQQKSNSWFASIKEVENHKCYRFDLMDKQHKKSFCHLHISDIRSNIILKSPVYIPISYKFDRHHSWTCPGSGKQVCKNAHCAFNNQDFAFVTKCAFVYSSGVWDYGCGLIGNMEVCDVYRLMMVPRTNALACYEIDISTDYEYNFQYYCANSKDSKSANGTAKLDQVIDTFYGKFEIKKLSKVPDKPYKYFCIDNQKGGSYVIETQMRKENILWTLKVDKEPMMSSTEIPANFISIKKLTPDNVEFDYIKNNLNIFLSNNYAFNVSDIGGLITYKFENNAFTEINYHPRSIMSELKFEIEESLVTTWVKTCTAVNCRVVDIVERDVKLKKQIYKVHAECENMEAGTDNFALISTTVCDVVTGGTVKIKDLNIVTNYTGMSSFDNEGFTFTVACSLGYSQVKFSICDQTVDFNVTKPYWDVYTTTIIAWENVKEVWESKLNPIWDNVRVWLKSNNLMKLFDINLERIAIYVVGGVIIYIMVMNGNYFIASVSTIVLLFAVYVAADDSIEYINCEDESVWTQLLGELSIKYDNNLSLIKFTLHSIVSSTLFILYRVSIGTRTTDARNCLNLSVAYVIGYMVNMEPPNSFVFGFIANPIMMYEYSYCRTLSIYNATGMISYFVVYITIIKLIDNSLVNICMGLTGFTVIYTLYRNEKYIMTIISFCGIVSTCLVANFSSIGVICVKMFSVISGILILYYLHKNKSYMLMIPLTMLLFTIVISYSDLMSIPDFDKMDDTKTFYDIVLDQIKLIYNNLNNNEFICKIMIRTASAIACVKLYKYSISDNRFYIITNQGSLIALYFMMFFENSGPPNLFVLGFLSYETLKVNIRRVFYMYETNSIYVNSYFIMYLTFYRLITGVSSIDCNYQHANVHGNELSRYLYINSINRTFLGINEDMYEGRKDIDCINYTQFKTKFQNTILSDKMIDVKDGIKQCCKRQYNNFINSACIIGMSYDDWYIKSMKCINDFSYEELKPIKCLLCKTNNVNMVVQSTTSMDLNRNGECYNGKLYTFKGECLGIIDTFIKEKLPVLLHRALRLSVLVLYLFFRSRQNTVFSVFDVMILMWSFSDIFIKYVLGCDNTSVDDYCNQDIVIFSLGCMIVCLGIYLHKKFSGNKKCAKIYVEENEPKAIITLTGRFRLGDGLGTDKININDVKNANKYFTTEELNEIKYKCPSNLSYDGLVHKCSISCNNTIINKLQALMGIRPKLCLDVSRIGNIVKINSAGCEKYGFVVISEDTGDSTLCTVQHNGGNRPIVSRQINMLNEKEYTCSSDLRILYPNLLNYETDVSFYGKPFKFMNVQPGELCYVFIPHALSYSSKIGCIACVVPVKEKLREGKISGEIDIKFTNAWKFYDPVIGKFFNPKTNQVRGMSGLPIFNKNKEVVGILSTFYERGEESMYINRNKADTRVIKDTIEEWVDTIKRHPRDKFLFVTLPTGTGKSTKLPFGLYNDRSLNYGENASVLVLNPLVNSVEQLHKYMSVQYKMHDVFKASSIENTITGNNVGITYMTYGHANVRDNFFDLIRKYDYVLMDEYHTMDEQVMQTLMAYNRVILETVVNPSMINSLPRVALTSATDLFGAEISSVNTNPRIKYDKVAINDIYSNQEWFPNIKGKEIPKETKEIRIYGLPINIMNFINGTKYCIFVATKKQCTILANWHKKNRPSDMVIAYFSGCQTKPIEFQQSVSMFNGTVAVYCTNYIESGVTIDFDVVMDTRKKIVPEIEWDFERRHFVRQLTTVTISPQEAVQRAGRVGRFKPGQYIYAIEVDNSSVKIKLEDVFNALLIYKFKGDGENGYIANVAEYIPEFICQHIQINYVHLFELLLNMMPAINRLKVKKVVELCNNKNISNDIPLWIKALNVAWDCADVQLKGSYAPVPVSYLSYNVKSVVAFDENFRNLKRKDAENVKKYNEYIKSMRELVNYSIIDEESKITHKYSMITIDWYNTFTENYKKLASVDPVTKQIVSKYIFIEENDIITNELRGLLNEDIEALSVTGLEGVIIGGLSTVVIATSMMSWIKRNAIGIIEESWVMADNISLSHHQFWDWRREYGMFSFLQDEAIPFRSEEVIQHSFEFADDDTSEDVDIIGNVEMDVTILNKRLAEMLEAITPDVDRITSGEFIYNSVKKNYDRLGTYMKRKSMATKELSQIHNSDDPDDWDNESLSEKLKKLADEMILEVEACDTGIKEINEQLQDLKNTPEYKSYIKFKTAKDLRIGLTSSETFFAKIGDKIVEHDYAATVDKIASKINSIEWSKLSKETQNQLKKIWTKGNETLPEYYSKLHKEIKTGVNWTEVLNTINNYSSMFGVTFTTVMFDELVETFGLLPIMFLLATFTVMTTLHFGMAKVFWILLGGQIAYMVHSGNANMNNHGTANILTSHIANIGTTIVQMLMTGATNSGVDAIIAAWQGMGSPALNAIIGTSTVATGSMMVSHSLSGVTSSSAISIAIGMHQMMSQVLNSQFDNDLFITTMSVITSMFFENPWTVFKGMMIGIIAIIIEMLIRNNADTFRMIIKTCVKGSFSDREIFKEFTKPERISEIIHWIMISVMFLLDPIQIFQIIISCLLGYVKGELEFNKEELMKYVTKNAGLSTLIWCIKEFHSMMRFLKNKHEGKGKQHGIEVRLTSKINMLNGLFSDCKNVTMELLKLPVRMMSIVWMDVFDSEIIRLATRMLQRMFKFFYARIENKVSWQYEKVKSSLRQRINLGLNNISPSECYRDNTFSIFDGDLIVNKDWLITNCHIINSILAMGYCYCGKKYEIKMHNGLYQKVFQYIKGCAFYQADMSISFENFIEMIDKSAKVLIEIKYRQYIVNPAVSYPTNYHMAIFSNISRKNLANYIDMSLNYGSINVYRTILTMSNVENIYGFLSCEFIAVFKCSNCIDEYHVHQYVYKGVSLKSFTIHNWGCQVSQNSLQELRLFDNNPLKDNNVVSLGIKGEIKESMISDYNRVVIDEIISVIPHSRMHKNEKDCELFLICSIGNIGEDLVIRKGTPAFGIMSMDITLFDSIYEKIADRTKSHIVECKYLSEWNIWRGNQFFNKELNEFIGYSVEYHYVDGNKRNLPVVIDCVDNEYHLYVKMPGTPVKSLTKKDLEENRYNLNMVHDFKFDSEKSYPLDVICKIYHSTEQRVKYLRDIVVATFPNIEKIKNFDMQYVKDNINLEDVIKEYWEHPINFKSRIQATFNKIKSNCPSLKMPCIGLKRNGLFKGIVNGYDKLDDSKIELDYIEPKVPVFENKVKIETIKYLDIDNVIFCYNDFDISIKILTDSKTKFDVDCNNMLFKKLLLLVYWPVLLDEDTVIKTNLREFKLNLIGFVSPFLKYANTVKFDVNSLTIIDDAKDVKYLTVEQMSKIYDKLETRPANLLFKDTTFEYDIAHYSLSEYVYDEETLPVRLDEYRERSWYWPQYMEAVNILYMTHVSKGKTTDWFYPPMVHPYLFKFIEEYDWYRNELLGLDSDNLVSSELSYKSCVLGDRIRGDTLLDYDQEITIDPENDNTLSWSTFEKETYPVKINIELIKKEMEVKINCCGMELNEISIIGDGNCCFRALSQQLFNSQDHFKRVKLLIKNAVEGDDNFNRVFNESEWTEETDKWGNSDHVLALCYITEYNYCEHSVVDGKEVCTQNIFNVNWKFLHLKNIDGVHWNLLQSVENIEVMDIEKKSGLLRTDSKYMHDKDPQPTISYWAEEYTCETSIVGTIWNYFTGKEDKVYRVKSHIDIPTPDVLFGNKIKGIPGYSMNRYYKQTDSVSSSEVNIREINRLERQVDEITSIVNSFGGRVWYDVCRCGKHERPDAGAWVSRGAFKFHELDDVYQIMTWGNRSLWVAEGRGGFIQMYMTKVSRLGHSSKHELYVSTGFNKERERPFIIDTVEVPKNVNYKVLNSVDSYNNILFNNDIRHKVTRLYIKNNIDQFVDFIVCDGGESAKTQKEAAMGMDDYIVSMLDLCYLKLRQGGAMIIKTNDIFNNTKQWTMLISHFTEVSTFVSPSQVNCSQEIYIVLKAFRRYHFTYIKYEDIKQSKLSDLFDDELFGENIDKIKRTWGRIEEIFHINSVDNSAVRYSIPGGRVLESIGKILSICRDKHQLMSYELCSMKAHIQMKKPLNYPKPLTSDLCTLINPTYNQNKTVGMWSVIHNGKGEPIKIENFKAKKDNILSSRRYKSYGCFWGIVNGTEYNDLQEELFINFCNYVRIPFDSEQYPNTNYLKWYGRIPLTPKYAKDKLQVMSTTGKIVKELINNNIDVLPVTMASKTREKWIESIQKKLNVKHRQLSEHDVMQCVAIGQEISNYNHEPWGLMPWEEIMEIIKPKASSGWLEDNRLKVLAEDPVIRNRIDRKLKETMEGVVPFVTWSANHKREARISEDEKFPKPRIIQFMDGESRLMFLRLIGYIQTRHNLNEKMYWGSNTGRSITDVGNYMKKEWDKYKKPVGIMMDIKSWDTNVTCEELCCMCECFKPHFKKDLHKGIETYFKLLLSPIVVDLEGNVFARKGQVSSGEITTSRGNGWLNITRCTQMIKESTGQSVQWIKDNVTMLCEGDDLVMIMEEKYAINVLSYSRKFLVRVNKPPKLVDDEGNIRFTKRFSELEFCSHTYQAVPINDQVHYLPHRPLPELLGKISVTKKVAGCEVGTPLSRELNRSKAISYLLLYPGQPVIRRIALMTLSKTGWGNYDTHEFEYLFGTISGSNSLMAAVRSVYGSHVEHLSDIGYFPHRVVSNDWFSLTNLTGESIDQYKAMNRCIKRFCDDAFTVVFKNNKLQSVAIQRNYDEEILMDFSFIVMDKSLLKMMMRDFRVKHIIKNFDQVNDADGLEERFVKIFVTRKEVINSEHDFVAKLRSLENREIKARGFNLYDYDIRTLTFSKNIEEEQLDPIRVVLEYKKSNIIAKLASRFFLHLGARVTITANE